MPAVVDPSVTSTGSAESGSYFPSKYSEMYVPLLSSANRTLYVPVASPMISYWPFPSVSADATSYHPISGSSTIA